MDLKIHQKVKIKETLKNLAKDRNTGVYLTEDMRKFAGKEVTISKVWYRIGATLDSPASIRFNILEDPAKHTWTEFMLEKAIQKKENSLWI